MRRAMFINMMVCTLIGGALFSCGGGGAEGGGAFGGRDLMMPVKRIKTPPSDYAVITFVRSSVMAFGVKAMLWDGEKLIGELTPRKYIQYKAEPGTHLFLAKSEIWSYLKANLSPGKHYIVTTEVFPGGNSARIALKPALPYEKEVTKTDVDAWLVSLTPESVQAEYAEVYAAPYLPETRKAVAEYDAGKVDFETLNAGDDWPHLALNPPQPEEKK